MKVEVTGDILTEDGVLVIKRILTPYHSGFPRRGPSSSSPHPQRLRESVSNLVLSRPSRDEAGGESGISQHASYVPRRRYPRCR